MHWAGRVGLVVVLISAWSLHMLAVVSECWRFSTHNFSQRYWTAMQLQVTHLGAHVHRCWENVTVYHT